MVLQRLHCPRTLFETVDDTGGVDRGIRTGGGHGGLHSNGMSTVLAVVMRRTVVTVGSQPGEPSDIQRPGIKGCGDAQNGHISGRHC